MGPRRQQQQQAQEPSLRRLLLVAALLRALLIAWGEAQDRVLAVKYTDIDYQVFTDAARYVAAGGSPFDRSTYRYSPLLAYLLLPNVLATRVWGKALFAAADVVVAWQVWALGRLGGASPGRCWWAALLWLYNPFTVTISTRGSCDSLVTVLLLGALLGLLRGRRAGPALLYGLAVHLRIYPIIYAPSIVLFLAHRQLLSQQQQRKVRGQAGSSSSSSTATGVFDVAASGGALARLAAVLRQGLVFGGLASGAFLALGAAFYRLYGQPFLQEAYLHHLGRQDPRHNFAPHFYPVYLQYMPWGEGGAAQLTSSSSSSSSSSGLISGLMDLLPAAPPPDVSRWAALPQAALLLVLAGALHQRLPLAWLLQTWAFVALNKVVTAQYFVWFLSLLPAVLAGVAWPPPRRLLLAGGGWAALQLHWLAWGYALEFQGAPVHLALWGAGAAFLAANAFAMTALIECCCGGAGADGAGAEAGAAVGGGRGRSRQAEEGAQAPARSRSRSRPKLSAAAAGPSTPAAGVRRSSRIAAGGGQTPANGRRIAAS